MKTKFDYFDDYSASELAIYLGLEENKVSNNMEESIEMSKEMATSDPSEYTCENETCRKYYSGDYNSGYCSEDCQK